MREVIDRHMSSYRPVEEGGALSFRRAIHKNVRSKDGVDVGTFIAEDSSTIIILQGASSEYRLPKVYVEGFDGAELWLGMTYKDLQNFRVE